MFRILLLPTSLLACAGAAAAQTPLQQALAAPIDGPKYSFNMTFQNGDERAEGRVDPSQPEGRRITVTSPPEADWDDDFRKTITQMDKDAKGDIWCIELAEIVPPDARQVSETDTTATYAFQPVAVDKEDKKVFKHLTGSITVSKQSPSILSLSMTAPKPFKPVVVAKVNSFNMTATCTPGPDGRAYLSRMDMKVSGKAMMKAFDQHTVQTISDLQPIPDQPLKTASGTP